MKIGVWASCGAGGLGRGVGVFGIENETGDGGVVMDESEYDRGNDGEKVRHEYGGKCEAESVGGEGLALVESVCLW